MGGSAVTIVRREPEELKLGSTSRGRRSVRNSRSREIFSFPAPVKFPSAKGAGGTRSMMVKLRVNSE